MIIQCPDCGEKVVVNDLGRKPLDIPLKNVRECPKKYRRVPRVAQELECSHACIFQSPESQWAEAEGYILEVEPFALPPLTSIPVLVALPLLYYRFPVHISFFWTQEIR